MITKLILKNFKSFEYAEIPMGPLTTLIGMNASGKSNIRDALRLLHGIGRGYTLAEAIGEKWGEGGYLEWKGIRGGAREMVYQGAESRTCEIGVEFDNQFLTRHSDDTDSPKFKGHYRIEIGFDGDGLKPKVKSESLLCNFTGPWLEKSIFHSLPVDEQQEIEGRLSVTTQNKKDLFSCRNDRPLLNQVRSLLSNPITPVSIESIHIINLLRILLNEMRFLDVSPDEMRKYSPLGQTILTERGENLSSVLETIISKPTSKQLLLDWMKELPQQEISDLTFYEDRQGFVLLGLVNSRGVSISADSASDGTLRFLAFLAALFSPDPAFLYFFEEIENGIHPSRLHLLVQLLEQRSQESGSQLLISTHSPQLLGYLSNESLQTASLVYRPKHSGGSIVKPILEIPNIQELLDTQNLSELHESGWFEDMMDLMDSYEEESGPDEL